MFVLISDISRCHTYFVLVTFQLIVPVKTERHFSVRNTQRAHTMQCKETHLIQRVANLCCLLVPNQDVHALFTGTSGYLKVQSTCLRQAGVSELGDGTIRLYFPDPNSCTKYTVCLESFAMQMESEPRMHFSLKASSCTFPPLAGCPLLENNLRNARYPDLLVQWALRLRLLKTPTLLTLLLLC